jgi:capsular polysaccharide transport system permease protein
MTTGPKAARFFLRRVERSAVPPSQPGSDLPFDTQGDGFGNVDFRGPAPDSAQAAAQASVGVQAAGQAAGETASPPDQGRALTPLPGDRAQIPARARPMAVPSTEQRAEVSQAAEILRMQTEIARRRRRRLALLAARLFAFVLLPTLLAGWYFYRIATPMYVAKAEFVIQQAGPASSGSGLGGLLSGTGFATSQDSVAVQAYLQSREAMLRLEEDVGFREHFQDPSIDPVQRLEPDASMEDAYGVYKRFVRISYDSSEGLVRMEVIAADPEVAASWARQLVAYAEEQVDHLTRRLRADQMAGAQQSYETAEASLAEAQQRLVELQEKFRVISGEAEVTLLTTQIATLESQLTTERIGLAQIESNASPNQARLDAVRTRIASLEREIALLRGEMTVGGSDGSGMAKIQSELQIAQADLATRQMLMAQALQSMETSQVEANRQVRYLSLAVSPTPTDSPAYPRAFENTLVTLLIMLGIYLMVAMTAAILREQVSA